MLDPWISRLAGVMQKWGLHTLYMPEARISVAVFRFLSVASTARHCPFPAAYSLRVMNSLLMMTLEITMSSVLLSFLPVPCHSHVCILPFLLRVCRADAAASASLTLMPAFLICHRQRQYSQPWVFMPPFWVPVWVRLLTLAHVIMLLLLE